MNIFQRARLGLDLSPAERVWLKTIKGLILTFIIVGLDAVMQFLALQGDLSKVSWLQVGLVFIGAAGVAAGHSADKYLTAHGLSELGKNVDTVATREAQQLTSGIVTTTTTVGETPIVASPDVTRGNTPIAIVVPETVKPPLPPAA